MLTSAALMVMLVFPRETAVTQVPPQLVIEKIVQTDLLAGSPCLVTLRNVHMRAAVAWLLVGPGGIRVSNDAVLDPNSAIRSGGSRDVLFPCPNGQSVPITLAAAQYEDGAIEGDRILFEKSVQHWRRDRIAGMRELLSLLAHGSGTASNQPRNALEDMIEQSEAPHISTVVKGHTKASLEQLRISGSDFSSLRAALTATMEKQVERLLQFAESR